MKLTKIAVSVLAAGLMTSPLAFATNGYFPIGYGQKNEAMGGASIALPLDSIAAANNPAGMVIVGDHTDVGLTWFKPNRSAQITGNDCSGGPQPCGGGTLNGTYSGNGRSNFFIPSFGYNRMINADTSVGVSVFGNGGMNTQYNTNPFAPFGATGNFGINLSQLFISPTWSKKVNPTNAVGVSLNLAYQMFSATGLGPFDNAGLSSNAGSVTDNGTDASTGYGIRIGWTGEVSPTVTLGATYQSKTKMGKLSKYKGLFAGAGSFDIPSNYGIGIAIKATPDTTVAFDVERTNYSDVPAVSTPFTDLPPAYGGSGQQLGSANGPGFGWNNITALKLGVSHAYNSTFTVRAGLDHCDQPIPDNQTLLNMLAPGVVQNHLSLGATWKLANSSEVSVAYVHAFKQTVHGTPNSIPAAFGAGEASITMHEDSIGISYGW